MSFKSWDTMSSVIDEACKKFGPSYELNEEKYDILKNYCDAFDILISETDADIFQVEIDDITMDINIQIDCPEMVIESTNHIYYKLAQRAKNIGFSAGEDTSLTLELEFPSIWSRVI